MKYIVVTPCEDFAGDSLVLFVNIYTDKLDIEQDLIKKLLLLLDYISDDYTYNAMVSIFLIIMVQEDKKGNTGDKNLILADLRNFKREQAYRENIPHLVNRAAAYRLDKCLEGTCFIV